MTWLRNGKGKPYSVRSESRADGREARRQRREIRNERIKNTLKGKTSRSAAADADRRDQERGVW